MLTIFRRHTKACISGRPQHDRAWRKCKCPISISGTIGTEHLHESLKTRTWELAAKRLVEAEARGWWKDAPNACGAAKTIPEALEIFLAEAASPKGRDLRGATLSKYNTLSHRLCSFAEQRKIATIRDLTPDHVRDFRNSWPGGARTAANQLNRLRCFLKFCLEQEWIEKNPGATVKPPKHIKEDTDQKQPFSTDELERVLAAAASDEELTTLIQVMVTTGLRISDAVFLTPAQVAGGELKVKTRKSGALVQMPLQPEVYQRLDKLPVKPTGYWFISGSTKLETATDMQRRKLNEVFRKAGAEKATPHRFRHTFASVLLQRGVPIGDVSLLLAHSSVTITEAHYAAWVPGRAQALADKLRSTWTKAASEAKPDPETPKSQNDDDPGRE